MTVQGQLNHALMGISKSSDIHSLAAGRTDAGVHALSQIVRIRIPLEIEGSNLVKAVNSHLPEDIRVLSAEKCPESFHPLRGGKKKEYRYFFSPGQVNPHFKDTVAFIRGKIDMERMAKGMELFVGKKNFSHYCCSPVPKGKSVIKEIFEAALRQRETHFPEQFTFFEAKFIGSGFLKQMVRLIMGTLFELGKGKRELAHIEQSFHQKHPTGPVAPACGLFLCSTTYKTPDPVPP